jgi:VCBS repeat-containing protein
MTDAGYKAAVEYMRGTVRRWGRGRILLVGVLGALMIIASLIYSEYAAGQGAQPVEGESFTHPPGTEVVTGAQYSGGKALKITSGQALPTKKVTITETSNVLVRARAGQTGGSPTLTIRVDGSNKGTRRITSNVLSDYLYAGIILQPGTYTIGLKGGDLDQGRYVFVDVVRFPAVTPPGGDPPVAVDDSATVAEDSGATNVNVLANDTDADGGTKTIASVTQPGNGAVAITGGGSGLTYEPDENYCNGGSPTDDFTYTLNGGSSAKVSVTVTCTNDAPVAIDDNYDVDEDQPLSIAAPGVLENDTDADASDVLSAGSTSPPGHASQFSLDANGSFGYTPSADFNGTDTFAYKADDGTDLSNEATVTITVSPLNDRPTDIALSNASVDENKPAGTTIGTLSSTDPDADDTHTYTLVSGEGDTDNGSFEISGGTLQTNEEFDFETKDTYSIRVQTDDGNGGTFEESFTITVTDANDQPSDISLSNDDVDENQPAATEVGTLSTTDQDSADTFTYELVSGTGDTDNGSFQISGSTLQTAEPLNFEDGATRSVLVKTSDGNGDTFEKQLTITVNDLNDAPTNLALSNNTVDENQPSGATVGTFSADDADGDTQTFAFASGTGDEDNGSFQISGNTLQTTEEFDFEAKDTYSIRVKADDGNGGTVEEEFTILVSDINDAPTDIELSPSSVDENQPSGTNVGTLSSADQDTTDTHTYTLVSGTGDGDNGSFQITGDTLQTNEEFDFESKDSYTIRVKTDDGNGGTFEKQLTISITNANDAPTDISLSNSSVDENQSSGMTVGTLSTTDPDSGETHTYSLVTGDGDTDNASFQITGATLQTNEEFDFEAKDSYSVRVKTDDGNGGTFEKQFTISITNANDTPTDITLSNSSVAENQPSGTTVGTFSSTDQDSADTHTYTLVSGDGSEDNGSFTITDGTLKTAAGLDFESKSSYTIRVKTDDGNGGTFEKQFTISITNANDTPTDITLSNSSVAENQPAGTDVGTFSSTDQDSGDTHTYTLVTGTGDTDNGQFTISGDTLKTNAQFNHEVKSSYTIRVKTDDGHGGTFEKQLTISITNANDAPTNLALSNSSVAENQPSGTTIGTLSTTDEDTADTHTYTLASGTGDTDNAKFQISGSALQTNEAFDFETKSSYTIRVKTDDGNGGTFEKQLTISVTNANDAPTDIALSKSDIDENRPSGTPVGTLSSTDQDSGDTHTYAFVSGTGSTDNGQFQIVSGELRTNASFNFEVKNSYSIRLSTTDNGSPTKSFEEVFTISINDVNDAPVATSDSYSGAIGNTKASRGVTVSGEPVVALTGNVLTNNDTDEDQPSQALSAVAETVSSTGGGSATITSNGSFTFLPGVGDKNQNDTFTYHVTDGTATASGTVTVGIANTLVWYVDNAKATNGDGRSSSPFNSLGGINAAGGTGDSDGSEDILFLYQGSGNYTGGLPLEANQQLLGQPNGLTVNNGVSNVTLVSPSGSRPTITNSSNNGITLGTGNTIRSLNVGNASNFGISGSSFGTLNVADTGINSTGQALSLSTGTLAGNGFTGVSSSGGTNNVSLSGVGTSGTFDLGSGTLSGASSDAFKVIGSGSFSYSGNISQASSGAPLVSVLGGHSGTLTFGTGTLSATGGTGLQFDNADGTYNFNGTTTLNGGDAGIDILNGSTGTFDFGAGTTITNPSGTAINLSGATASNAAVTYSGSISKNNAGFAVDIDNHDSGTVTFQTGTLSSTGTSSGVRVANSNGGQINFNTPTKTLNTGANKAVTLDTNNGSGGVAFGNGGLDIDTTSGAGFSATGGGTITVGTGANPNTIDSTTTGTALNVANTTIGSSGLNFRSISAGPASGTGPTNGIVLNNTGTSGGLTVTGDGGASSNNSGGTIRRMSGDGVILTSTQDVRLGYMNITNNLGDGIGGSGINGLVLTRDNITGNGNDAATDESGINIAQLTGTTSGGARPTSITNTTISNNNEFEMQITNNSGTLADLTMSGNTISSNGLPINGNATSPHGNLFNFLGGGTSVMKLTVTSGTFTGNWNPSSPPATITATAISAVNQGTSHTVNVSGATFTNNNVGVDVSSDPVNNLILTFDIHDNTITGSRAVGINSFQNGNPPYNRNVNGKIQNNTIGTLGVAGSGSLLGNGISIQNEGAVPVNVLISGNTIQEVQSFPGISSNVGLGGLATGGLATNLTITNNTIRNIGSRGITVQDNQTLSPFPTVCANISGNSFSNIAGQAGNGEYMRVRRLNGTVKVTQATPTSAANAAELDDANGFNDPTKINVTGTVNFNAGACTLPNN